MLAKQIFRQELTEIYSHQTKRRDELTKSAGEVLRQLAAQMQDGTLDIERIEQLMKHFSEKLKTTSGKKKYGYLKAPLKPVVDEIVDELCKAPRVAGAYDLWYELHEDVLKTHKDTMPECVPLSQQKELKRIKNIVIEEAIRVGADRQSVFSASRDSDVPIVSRFQSANLQRVCCTTWEIFSATSSRQQPALCVCQWITNYNRKSARRKRPSL